MSSYGKLYADEEMRDAMKSGNIHTIRISGYEEGEVFIYELTEIEKNGRTYKLERND